MTGTIDPARTRPALLGGESLFGAGLMCPEGIAAIQALGVPVDIRQVNFVTRSAPMGPVPANVTIAVFFNFNPDSVRQIIPAAWQAASPEAILAAQQDAFDAPLAAALGALDPGELAEYARLQRTSAEAACEHIEGRALFGVFAALAWPRGDHLVAWHAAKLLREHRGDGHVAGLVQAGLSGIEALVVHEAYEPALAPGILRRSRSWGREAWDVAADGLRARGWLTDDAERLTLTEQGTARRRAIEERTNELAAVAYEPIGPDGVERLVVLGAKVGAAVRAAGLTLEALFKPMLDKYAGTAD